MMQGLLTENTASDNLETTSCTAKDLQHCSNKKSKDKDDGDKRLKKVLSCDLTVHKHEGLQQAAHVSPSILATPDATAGCCSDQDEKRESCVKSENAQSNNGNKRSNEADQPKTNEKSEVSCCDVSDDKSLAAEEKGCEMDGKESIKGSDCACCVDVAIDQVMEGPQNVESSCSTNSDASCLCCDSNNNATGRENDGGQFKDDKRNSASGYNLEIPVEERNKPERDVDGNSDTDDSVCMCCIKVLINEPGVQTARDQKNNSIIDSPLNDVANAAIAHLEAYSKKLRACCKSLEKYCIRRACCFTSHPRSSPNQSSTFPPSRLPNGRDNRLKSTLDSASIVKVEDAQHKENLRLQVRGMDCVDCVPKVGRALSQLPSVVNINVDYFSGVAELRYDPEAITPAAIINYVSRATGFGIKALTVTSSNEGTTIVTLPLSFSTIPPSQVFDGFDISFRSDPHVVEVSFPVHVDHPPKPRDVFEQFKLLGAELIPMGSNDNLVTHDLIRVGIRTLACAILSIPVLVLAWADLPHKPVLYGSISVGMTTLMQGVAFPLISSAIRSIFYLRQADMSVLVAISMLSAYTFSVVSFAFEAAGKPFASPFFETNALLVTLIYLGRTIAAYTRRSTGSVLRELERIQPTKVLLLADKGAPPQSLDSRLLYYGDIIRIPPETRIATDGLVVSGSSDVDESSVTGESAAVSKQNGSRVIAGTLNLGGTLDVQVTKIIHENSLSHIMTLVKQAQSSRSPVQDLADRLSAVILPVATMSACAAFVIWILVGRFVRHQSAAASSVEALTYAIATLVVSCPCAIGLSVPIITAIAVRIGLREGVLFRSAGALQTSSDIDIIAFDKTGTLTQGIFTVERAEFLVEGAEQIVSTLVKNNKHPVSQGVHSYLTTHVPSQAQHDGGIVMDIISLPGRGIKASIAGYPLLGGNPNFTGACSHPRVSDLQTSGFTLFTVTLAGQLIAMFGLSDTPRPEASMLVKELTYRGKEVMILSGDTLAAVQHLANTIGVPPSSAHSSCSPEDKDAMIVALQADGKRVCFVGDGTNDGPALCRADVSLGIAAGSDVAITAAEALLLGSDLRRGVITLLDVAAMVRAHAYWALGWCVVYNFFAVLLASGLLVKVRIEPRWAGIGEVVSIVPVVAIAFGLDVRWSWRGRA